MTFGIFYDDDGFVLTTFGKPSKLYAYKDIKAQQIYTGSGNVIIELYMVDGRAELDKFFTLFDLEGDEEDFESQTVSGWVIEQTGTFPKKFDSFEYKNLTIITNKLTQRRVLDVKVVINPDYESGESKDN